MHNTAAPNVKENDVGGGGAFASWGSVVNIQGSRFEGNLGKYGGAIYLDSSADHMVDDDGRDDDGVSGCDIIIINSTFLLNGHNTSFYGGALYSWATQLLIDASTFQYNSVQCMDMGRGGGAMWVDGASSLTLNSSHMVGNAGPQGGALFLLGDSTSQISNTEFSTNQAYNPPPPPSSVRPTGSYGGESHSDQDHGSCVMKFTIHSAGKMGIELQMWDSTGKHTPVVCDDENFMYDASAEKISFFADKDCLSQFTAAHVDIKAVSYDPVMDEIKATVSSSGHKFTLHMHNTNKQPSCRSMSSFDAKGSGGAVKVFGAFAGFDNCIFHLNVASGLEYGAAVYCDTKATANFTGCEFVGNGVSVATSLVAESQVVTFFCKGGTSPTRLHTTPPTQLNPCSARLTLCSLSRIISIRVSRLSRLVIPRELPCCTTADATHMQQY
jgi:hypothetical protein